MRKGLLLQHRAPVFLCISVTAHRPSPAQRSTVQPAAGSVRCCATRAPSWWQPDGAGGTAALITPLRRIGSAAALGQPAAKRQNGYSAAVHGPQAPGKSSKRRPALTRSCCPGSALSGLSGALCRCKAASWFTEALFTAAEPVSPFQYLPAALHQSCFLLLVS